MFKEKKKKKNKKRKREKQPLCAERFVDAWTQQEENVENVCQKCEYIQMA